jgi:addiction module HigA family antidote
MSTTETPEQAAIPTPSVGEILSEEFLEPLEITPYRLAKDVHVATSSILDIVHDRRRLSVDMALRLSRYFGTSERFWLNLQNEIDIRNRRESLARDLETIHPVQHSA